MAGYGWERLAFDDLIDCYHDALDAGEAPDADLVREIEARCEDLGPLSRSPTAEEKRN